MFDRKHSVKYSILYLSDSLSITWKIVFDRNSSIMKKYSVKYSIWYLTDKSVKYFAI